MWELFAKLVRQRGPKSVKITKVKGHATQAMVDEGKVKQTEKTGNDKADEAAEAGATTSQGKIRDFAEMYSWRHIRYRKFMAKIQHYIVELKKEEKKQKQQHEKEKDPFGRKEASKVEVQRNLKYADEAEAASVEMHEIQKQWCKDEEEWKYTKGVQDVIKRMKWGKRKARKAA